MKVVPQSIWPVSVFGLGFLLLVIGLSGAANIQETRHIHEQILAVEDNPEIRATVVRQLRDLGYRVHEAGNANAALQILDGTERVDLLFTDMVLPGGLNGKELALKARAKRADLKVLFTSGFPGTSDRGEVSLEPNDVLLSKPYHKRELAKAIAEALHTPL